MIRKIIFVIAIITSFKCSCQIIFEKGYYIDNSNQKVDCFIKNLDWYNNPTKFAFKLSNETKEKEISIKEVKEFGIYNVSKYIRSTLNVDRSSETITNLTPQKEPIFVEEVLFLKIIVEGRASLFFYKDENLEKYFYKTDNKNTIEQLIHKNYLTFNNSIAINNNYLVQLWNDLKCPDFTMKMMDKIEYKEDDLVDFFKKYNQCNDSKSTIYEKKSNWDWLNLSLKPRINSSSLSLKNNNIYNISSIDFKNNISISLGFEAEIIMKFNKNKWALVVEPTYQYYKDNADYYPSGGSISKKASVEYKTIEIPLGIRYYFFLKNNSKIFVDAFLVPEFNLNSKITVNNNTQEFQISVAPTFAFGIGYKLKNKYSIEYRYTTTKNIIENYKPSWVSNLNNSSLIFGYTFF